MGYLMTIFVGLFLLASDISNYELCLSIVQDLLGIYLIYKDVVLLSELILFSTEQKSRFSAGNVV